MVWRARGRRREQAERREDEGDVCVRVGDDGQHQHECHGDEDRGQYPVQIRQIHDGQDGQDDSGDAQVPDDTATGVVSRRRVTLAQPAHSPLGQDVEPERQSHEEGQAEGNEQGQEEGTLGLGQQECSCDRRHRGQGAQGHTPPQEGVPLLARLGSSPRFDEPAQTEQQQDGTDQRQGVPFETRPVGDEYQHSCGGQKRGRAHQPARSVPARPLLMPDPQLSHDEDGTTGTEDVQGQPQFPERHSAARLHDEHHGAADEHDPRSPPQHHAASAPSFRWRSRLAYVHCPAPFCRLENVGRRWTC